MNLKAVPGRLARKGAGLVMTIGAAAWRRGARLVTRDAPPPPSSTTTPPAAAPAAPVAAPPVATPATEPPQAPPTAVAPAPEPDVLVASSADPGAEGGVGATLHVDEPWPGYRQMTAADITDRLVVADRSTLGAVQLYESLHRRRSTVISEAGRRLAQAAR